MRELVLNKQNNQEVKKQFLEASVKRRQITFVKPLLMLAVLTTFILLSLKNDKLFLSELLISGGILILVFIVYLLSQKEAIRKNF